MAKVVDMKVLSTYLTTLTITELVVDGTVVSKDNKKEKSKEVADIRMNHFCWNFSTGI